MRRYYESLFDHERADAKLAKENERRKKAAPPLPEKLAPALDKPYKDTLTHLHKRAKSYIEASKYDEVDLGAMLKTVFATGRTQAR